MPVIFAALRQPPAPTIITTGLPLATQGQAYSFQMQAQGGTPPYTWTASGLPTGLSISSGGLISGTPSVNGTLLPVFTVTDSLGIPSSPTPISLQVQIGASLPGPQAVFQGPTDSFSNRIVFWHTVNGSADSYNAYRTDVAGGPIATGIVPTLPNNGPIPQLWYEDFDNKNTLRGTTRYLPGQTYGYFFTGVFGGVESLPSPTIMTTARSATAGAAPPVSPTSPDSYFPSFALPGLVELGTGSGTRWLVTLGTPAQFNTAGTANSYNGKLSVNCGLQYALSNCAVGDLIVVSSGLTFLHNTAGTIFLLPNTNGPAPTYIITDQDPVYRQQFSLSTGTLPAYSNWTNQFLAYTLVTLASTTVTDTAGNPRYTLQLSAPWTGRTGYFTVRFKTTAPPGFETRDCHFVNGSSTISFGSAGGFVPSTLKGTITSTGAVAHVGNYVTPDDAASMPTINCLFTGGGTALKAQANSGFFRLVGLHIGPQLGQASNQAGKNLVDLATSSGVSNIFFDRCYLGGDTTAPNWSPQITAVDVGSDFTGAHQCCIVGIHAGPTSGSDSQCWATTQGGPQFVRNCKLEAASENILSGGLYTPQNNIGHDIWDNYNFYHKNGAWDGTDIANWVKNLHENKVVIRCDSSNNIMWNCWSSQQTGQRGSAYTNGSIDQAAAAGSRTLSGITWANGVAQASANFMNLGPTPVGSLITLTISGVTPAGFNGTFNCTVVSVSGNSVISWQIPNPGSATGSGGTVSNHMQATCPWNVVQDLNITNNCIEGVCTGIYIHGDEGQQMGGRVFRVRHANNHVWGNPACLDTHNDLNQVRAFLDAATHVTDVTWDNNTSVIPPNGSGYLDPTSYTAGMEILTNVNTFGAPGFSDGRTITDNILDGQRALSAASSSGGSFQGNGPTVLANVFQNVLWTNNATVLENIAGYPGTNFLAVPLTNMMTGFVSNVTAPTNIFDWNVNKAPYATSSTTGGPLGAFIVPPAQQPNLATIVAAGYIVVSATAIPGQSKTYAVDPTGVTDSRAGIQAAIDDGCLNFQPVYLPHQVDANGNYTADATYAIGNTLRFYQFFNQNTSIVSEVSGHTFQGATSPTGTFPTIKATGTAWNSLTSTGFPIPMVNIRSFGTNTPPANLTPATSVPWDPYGLPPSNVQTNFSADVWDGQFLNFNLNTNGGTQTVALNVNGAQCVRVANIGITATGSHSGVGVVPGNGSVLTNISITGGVYGVDAQIVNQLGWQASNPTIVGLTCTGQTSAAVTIGGTNTGGLNIVGFNFSNVPAALNANFASTNGTYSIGFHNGIVNGTGTTAFPNPQGWDMYLEDVYISGFTNVTQFPGNSAQLCQGTWTQVQEYCCTNALTGLGGNASSPSYNIIAGVLTAGNASNVPPAVSVNNEPAVFINGSFPTSQVPTNSVSRHIPTLPTIDNTAYVDIRTFGAVPLTYTAGFNPSPGQGGTHGYFNFQGWPSNDNNAAATVTDCASAFSQAIQAAHTATAAGTPTAVMVPLGNWYTSQPVTLLSDTIMFGFGRRRSAITPVRTWHPTTQTPLIVTPAGGNCTWMGISPYLRRNPTSLGQQTPNPYPFDWFTYYNWQSAGNWFGCTGDVEFLAEEGPNTNLVTNNLMYTQISGGGRFYGVDSGPIGIGSPATSRFILIHNTTSPLYIYSLNVEHSKNTNSSMQYNVEINNVQNLRSYGGKREGNGNTFLVTNNSQNIGLFGSCRVISYGGSGGFPQVAATEVAASCSNILVHRHRSDSTGTTQQIFKDDSSGLTVVTPGMLSLYKTGTLNDAAMVIGTVMLPQAQVGVFYSVDLSTIFGAGTYTLVSLDPNWNKWASISGSVLSGTPQQVELEQGVVSNGTKQFNVSINVVHQ